MSAIHNLMAVRACRDKVWSLRFDQLSPEARAIFRAGDEIFFKHSKHPGRCLTRLRQEETSTVDATAHKSDSNNDDSECSACETDDGVRWIVAKASISLVMITVTCFLLGSWWFNGLDRIVRVFVPFYLFRHVLPAVSPTVKRTWMKMVRFNSEYERLDKLKHAHFMDRFLDFAEVYMYDWAFSFNRVHKSNLDKCTRVGIDQGLLIVRLQPYPDLVTSRKLPWLNNRYLTYRDRQRVKLAAMEYARLESQGKLFIGNGYDGERGLRPVPLQWGLCSGKGAIYCTDPSQYLRPKLKPKVKGVEAKAGTETNRAVKDGNKLERLISIWDLFGNPLKYVGHGRDASKSKSDIDDTDDTGDTDDSDNSGDSDDDNSGDDSDDCSEGDSSHVSDDKSEDKSDGDRENETNGTSDRDDESEDRQKDNSYAVRAWYLERGLPLPPALQLRNKS